MTCFNSGVLQIFLQTTLSINMLKQAAVSVDELRPALKEKMQGISNW
jgi:hypothetical protein